jgi:hypothetical protein
MGPVQPGSGEELDALAVDARVHAVAVVFYFVEPAAAFGRFYNEARQLRLDPLWRSIWHRQLRIYGSKKEHFFPGRT